MEYDITKQSVSNIEKKVEEITIDNAYSLFRQGLNNLAVGDRLGITYTKVMALRISYEKSIMKGDK